MSLTESPIQSPIEVLQTISHDFSFSTFVHFRVLADAIRTEKATPQQWQDVLDGWEYSPASFLTENKRGNCVDFARYGQQALASAGVHANIIGSEPSGTYTSSQQSFMTYRHTSLAAGGQNSPVMYEPGWKISCEIPLLPTGHETDTGSWKFATDSLNGQQLVQKTTSPTGYTWQRRFSLDPVAADTASDLTKRLLRVPRKLDMITQLDDDTPHYVIGYNPKSGMLTGNIEALPGPFTAEDLTPDLNEQLSDAYGYDVKEELVASMGLLQALPEEYWIK